MSGISFFLGYRLIITTRTIDNIQTRKRYRYKPGMPDNIFELLKRDKIG
jgi:hypothetical protein